jgi:hypothetical protein
MLPKDVILAQNQRKDQLHKDLYSCKPPPIFMFAITLIEVQMFTICKFANNFCNCFVFYR